MGITKIKKGNAHVPSPATPVLMVAYVSISRYLLLYILVLVNSTILLVSDLSSVSSFFRDELSAPVLHFFSTDRGGRGLQE